MLIPTFSSNDILCPSKLIARSVGSDFSSASNVVSTADSFKSWGTCMDNSTCKIVAIVLIVVAALLVLWVLMAVISCCCMGKQIVEGCCFCFTCCCPGPRAKPVPVQYVEKPSVYNNPNMYPQQPVFQYQNPPTPAHFANQQRQYEGTYNGYQPVSSQEERNPFHDEPKNRY